jgi:hypothetical protein
MGDQERHHRAMAMALINDPQHWHERAEGTRRIAEDMADPEAKRMMLNIADGYDRLAQHAETRLLTGKT